MTDFEKRLNDMESRLVVLENRNKHIPCRGHTEVTSDLVNRYGEHVNKTMTAKILGVTRATGVCDAERWSNYGHV